eukprot:CAMPEP_0174348980 /NCGR_PEP_ID=MMETSP0811_2-20130205/5607_1 /TAXON_ID=73025 ORGANISM="Eutreptiella gymnastica-like, Strain CCMP1594" /NCGR_SAMPLE_ID=MMETSP0811_2 /ASSEMBLY_ACC=CAM_ASM_000667 /LENGTH=399 /DNA_ID=CAMNT_0015476017 /DNA_START=21 /DNA_END=1217 /DNA_ORIENTATION=+
MSKLSEFVCPPVAISEVEAKVAEYRKCLEQSYSDYGVPVVVVIENKSGRSLKLADQRCETGKWLFGPYSTLKDGQAMVMLVAQAPQTLSGVGVAVVLDGEGVAISCCMERTVMDDCKVMGQITDKEDRIAETVFREALQAPEAETCKGLAQHEKFMLTWTGAPDTRIFTVYPAEQHDTLQKWMKINESEIEPTSIFSTSPGLMMYMIETQSSTLYKFLEATLAGAFTELNYTEGYDETKETVEEYVQRDMAKSVDMVWEDFDKDKNGYLDEDECHTFMSHFFAIFVHEAPAVIGKLMTKQKEDPQHYNYQLAEDAETRIKAMVERIEVKQFSQEVFRDMWNVENQVSKEDFVKAFLGAVQRLLQPIKEVAIESKIKEEHIEAKIEMETGTKPAKKTRPW